ncbi:MAG: zinc ribbon domain-containing protein [Rhodospirillales bacterium]|nr:zinc ribbon domain-containing protein [Rhodospirillales bacterium]
MTLISCPECGKSLSDRAFMCPHCGVPTGKSVPLGGYEYRSEQEYFGLPLIHIATGYDPKTGRKRIAKGIIAIGDVAVGGVAIGGVAFGGLTLGGCSIGLLSLGGLAIGILLALGGCAIGGVALGGGAIGVVAIGGGAFGYYALGGGAGGAYVIDAVTRDPEAVEFFSEWLGEWVQDIGRRRW